jgi:hypothetical protein
MDNMIISCTTEVKDRLYKLIPKGDRSAFIVRAINEKLDELENKKRRDVWLHSTVIEALRDIVRDYSFGKVVKMSESHVDRLNLMKDLNDADLSVNESEVKELLSIVAGDDDRE